jgi:hypothetical protein
MRVFYRVCFASHLLLDRHQTVLVEAGRPGFAQTVRRHHDPYDKKLIISVVYRTQLCMPCKAGSRVGVSPPSPWSIICTVFVCRYAKIKPEPPQSQQGDNA